MVDVDDAVYVDDVEECASLHLVRERRHRNNVTSVQKAGVLPVESQPPSAPLAKELETVRSAEFDAGAVDVAFHAELHLVENGDAVIDDRSELSAHL